MKVQFMKKLVPLALITSIAVTNVGITSVAAQTPTNAITQSVEGPVAVENESVSVGAGETTTVDPIAAAKINHIKTGVSDLKAKLVAGSKFKYTYAYGDSSKTPDDNQWASVTIQLPIADATVATPADFEGVSSLFKVAKSDAADFVAADGAYQIAVRPIAANGTDSDPFEKGGVEIQVALNYKLYKAVKTNSNKFTVLAKTAANAYTSLGDFTVDETADTGNVVIVQAEPVEFAENTKGEAVKFKIEAASSNGIRPGYNLVSYKAYEMTDGSFVYPGELEALGQTAVAPYTSIPATIQSDLSYDGQVVATLTPAQVAALPYTTAKAATEAEYEALGDTDEIDGNTKTEFKAAVEKAQVDYIKKIVAAYKAGPGPDQTHPTEDFTKAVTALTGLIDGMQTQANKDAVKAAAKTTVGTAGDGDDVAGVTGLKFAGDLTTKINTEKKALFVDNYATVMATDKAVFANLDQFNNVKDTAEQFTDKDYLDAFVASNDNYLQATSLADFLTKTGFTKSGDLQSNKYVWANYINSDTGYKTKINDLSWEDSSDESIKDAMKYASINEFISTVDVSKTALAEVLIGNSKKYFEDSTAWTAKIADLKKELLEGDYAHKSVLDTASINWITETVNAKGDLASGAAFAKFAVTKNDKTSFAAKTTGDSVIVGATKANKQTNSYVIVKAVSKNYKAATAKTAQKGDVYAQAEFYVTPVASTGFTERSLSTTAEKPGIKFEAPTATADTTNGSQLVYTLTLDEGKSYKLPFALKDGADKSLSYDVKNVLNSTKTGLETGVGSEAKGFTVVNGTVKAIAGGGQGTIEVYPTAEGDTWTTDSGKAVDKTRTIRVKVVTESKVKQIKANANNVTMYPGATQYISFGTNPASFGTYTYEITGADGYTATWTDTVGGTGNATGDATHTVLKLIAPQASALTAETTPAKTVKATVKIKKGTDEVEVKEFPLTIKWAGAGANAKTVKETYKKVNSDGVVEINVPVGGVVNLGASVNPATADQSIKYIATKDVTGATPLSGKDAIKTVKNTWATGADATVTTAGTNYTPALVTGELTMTGDVIKANNPGTYYVKGWTAAKNEKGENLTTNIYKINVYTPGASIIMNDQRDSNKYDTNNVTETANTQSDTPLTLDKVYTIVGGNLMTKAAAETDGNKTIMGGQTITIAEPYTLGTSEEIDWKCNKPSAIRITKGTAYHIAKDNFATAETRTVNDEVYQTLNLDLMQAGTFTITGTTKYTKQKFVFKVNVGAVAGKDRVPNDEKLYFDYDGRATEMLHGGTSNAAVADDSVEMAVKDTASVGYFTGVSGMAGTVKYEAVDKKVLSVAANGTVKALAKGSTAIKATFTSADKKKTYTVTSPKIKVTPQTATISKFTIPSGVSIGKDFNVSAAIKDAKIADCTVTWDYAKIPDGKNLSTTFDPAEPKYYDGSNDQALSLTSWSLGNKPSGKVKLADDGTYLVRLKVAPKTDATDANTVYEYGIVEAFEKTPTIVNVNNNDADAKKAIAALAAAPKAGEEEGTTVGGAGYGVYIIPVFATDKDNSTIDPGDIEWTSSNVSLATAEAIDLPTGKDSWEKVDIKNFLTTASAATSGTAVEEENAIMKAANNAYGMVRITTAAADSGLTGKVTLTGVLKNSGKKVTVTLNIKNEAKKVVDKYAPIDATKGTAKTDLTAQNGFQNVAELKGDVYTQSEIDKLAKGKTYTYYEYVIVDTTDAKLLKAKPADHIKVKNTYDANGNASGGVTVDANGVITGVSAIGTEGTYYLAQVAVTAKVKTAVEKNEDGTPKANSHAELEATPTKQVITIASNTPYIVKTAGA